VVKAANINGVTDLIINKADILAQVGVFKYVHNGILVEVPNLDEFKAQINDILYEHTDVEEIVWSMTPNGI
jgi:adenylosuccinate synthase